MKIDDTIKASDLKNPRLHVEDADNIRLQRGVLASAVTVRLTDVERRSLEAKAAERGVKLSRFLRNVILGGASP